MDELEKRVADGTITLEVTPEGKRVIRMTEQGWLRMTSVEQPAHSPPRMRTVPMNRNNKSEKY